MRNALVLIASIGIFSSVVWGCAATGSSSDELDGSWPQDASDAAGAAGGAREAGSGGGGGNGGPSDGNRRPELKRIGDREFPVGQQSEIQLEASDPNGDLLFFNLRSSLPDGAKFAKETGNFTWTPEPRQQGTVVLTTFEVSDGALKDQETVQILVVGQAEASNKPPEFEEIGDKAVIAGQPFTLTVVATDPNGDPLTYSMRGDELSEASLDPESGVFTWTPARDLVGQSLHVTFVASDGEAEAEAVATFVVRDETVEAGNMPPIITPIDDFETQVGQQVIIEVQAQDDQPEALQYSVRMGPEGHQFDTANAVFTWTPTAVDADRTHRVVFHVTDGEFRAIERVEISVIASENPVPGCQPDAAEPDDGRPAPLEPGVPIGDRSICPAGDFDGYTVSLTAGQQFELALEFLHAQGDLDLRLTGPENFDRVAATTSDNEMIRGRAPVDGAYSARVFGYSEVESPRYVISLTLFEGPACQDDPAEGNAGNDNAQSAAPLQEYLGVNLQICADNHDVFYVDLEAGTTLTVRALFQHALGDLDLALLTPAGTLHTVESSNDNEEINLQLIPQTGRYYIEVFGYHGAENAYRLELETHIPPPCAADRLEPNNAVNQAQPIAPEFYRGLSWCGEPDWFKTQLAAGDTLNVFLSYDAGHAPAVAATNLDGTPIEGSRLEVAAGDRCEPGRRGCRRLTLTARRDGWIYYGISEAEFAMAYDLRVEVLAAGLCDELNQTCDVAEVCDYAQRTCVNVFCDPNGDGCPDGYICHQEWCVEPCQDGGRCRREGQTCKRLGDLDLCGTATVNGQVGAPCDDFTDCGTSLDCRTSDPGGYCTRQCTQRAECGDSAMCGSYFDGNRCAHLCRNQDECQPGYRCVNRARADESVIDQVCEPAN